MQMSGKIDAVDRGCELYADLDNGSFRAWERRADPIW